MNKYILAIDQGTSSTRAIIFNAFGDALHQHQIEHQQYYPQIGWVEHDPEEIWQNTVMCCQQVIAKANMQLQKIAAIGITNQRETTVIWDKQTGKAIYPAIVWQDRRTHALCETLRHNGLEKIINIKTGLLLDPYFSATKIAWILDHVSGARQKAETGKLAFGTIECFLLSRLTNGRAHITDVTNAARTSLLNLNTLEWDQELLEIFNIPQLILPQIKSNCADFGMSTATLFGKEIPILGMAGDQQAASVGQGCVSSGMAKCTYGTGGFLLMNTGSEFVKSEQRLLSTILYQINDQLHYALEGSIFTAGAGVKWLRDKLKIINTAAETENMASQLDSNAGVYFIPALTGLGAPYWDPHARAALFGLTSETGNAHIVRAVLESICYQTKDLMIAMTADANIKPNLLRVDGGMVVNNWLMQYLADMLQIPVQRPTFTEVTARGVAFLAGIQCGLNQFSELVSFHQQDKIFSPSLSEARVDQLYEGWQDAVSRIISPKPQGSLGTLGTKK